MVDVFWICFLVAVALLLKLISRVDEAVMVERNRQAQAIITEISK